MDQDKSHAESESRRGRNPSGADSRIGHIFPSEVRAVLSVLGEHLQHSPDATEIARLTTSAAPDPDVYLLFFGDVYLGTITRQPGKNTGDADDFMHTPPGRGHV